MTNVIPLRGLGAAAEAPAPSLESGMKGPLVTELQKNLKAWGFDPGPIDGVFGPLTKNAVQAMQRRLNLSPSGMIDKPTRAAMAADLASPASVLRSSNPLAKPAAPASAAPAPELVATPFYKQPWFLLLAAGAAALLLVKGSGNDKSYEEMGLEDVEENEIEGGDAGDPNESEDGEQPEDEEEET